MIDVNKQVKLDIVGNVVKNVSYGGINTTSLKSTNTEYTNIKTTRNKLWRHEEDD